MNSHAHTFQRIYPTIKQVLSLIAPLQIAEHLNR